MSIVSGYLSSGEECATSMAELSQIMNVPERVVRQQILKARLNGELIVSSEKGYFLPADNVELREYINRRRAFIKTASNALKPFVKAIQQGVKE